MATFSDIRAIHGLQGVGTLAADNHSGTVTIGTTQTSTRLTNATKIKAITALIVGTASDLVIDVSDMDSTGSTAWTAGAAQIETATVVAASGITGNGNAEVIVTAADVTGSPVTVTVAVTTALTTATLVAGALRTAVAANTAISSKYTVGGTGAIITLTRMPTSTYTVNGVSVPVYPANDATLNIATQNGTCTGITTAASSANTTSGVLTAGAYCTFLDGSDFAGEAAAGIASIVGLEITNTDQSIDYVDISQGGFLVNYPLSIGQVFHTHGVLANPSSGDITISPNGFYVDNSALVSVVITGY